MNVLNIANPKAWHDELLLNAIGAGRQDKDAVIPWRTVAVFLLHLATKTELPRYFEELLPCPLDQLDAYSADRCAQWLRDRGYTVERPAPFDRCTADDLLGEKR